MTEADEIRAIEFDMIRAQLRIEKLRIAQLEQTSAALDKRIRVLEVALSRASHGPADEPATRPRRIVDDRGIVVTLRESAA